MKKDYQRMTEKAKDGSPALITEMIFHELEKLQGQGKRRYYTDSDVLNIVIKYLAELEDKIENGTLVELPCKVGDVLYYVKKYEPTPRIEENKVHTIEIYECRDGLTIRIWTQNGTFYADKMPNVFKTKSEAEAKLKELQGAER